MTETRSEAEPQQEVEKPAPIPELVTGRGERERREYALKRLKRSPVLQVTMVAAFLCYGAVPVFVIWEGKEGRPRLDPVMAGVLVLLSLASWSLLFWWYPVLERTTAFLGTGDRGQIIARTLETLAISCVVVVHALMVFIIIYKAGEG